MLEGLIITAILNAGTVLGWFGTTRKLRQITKVIDKSQPSNSHFKKLATEQGLKLAASYLNKKLK